MGGRVGGRSVSVVVVVAVAVGVVVVVGGGAAAFDAVLWLSSASRPWPRSWPLVCLCTASFFPASLRVVLVFPLCTRPPSPPPPAPPRLLTRSSGTNLNFVTHNSFTHGFVTHTQAPPLYYRMQCCHARAHVC